jgi:probable phosphoglycerate mutase
MLAAPPGGESWEAFEQRVARAFDDALQRQAACAGTLAVVTHGLVIRAMLARHVVLPGGACAPDHLGNASVCVIQAGPPHRALRVNSTEHLDEDLRDHPKGLSGG